MSIPLTCPYCRQRINVSKQDIEQNVRCRYCNKVFFVSLQVGAVGSPETDSSTSVTPPPPPAIGQNEISVIRSRVRRPAVALIATGAATTLAGLMFLPALLFPEMIGQQAPVDSTEVVLSLILMAVTLSLGIVTLYGGLKMFQFDGYRLAMASAIAAMIPCYCCFLGLPAGIWAVVVLRDPAVRRAFTIKSDDA